MDLDTQVETPTTEDDDVEKQEVSPSILDPSISTNLHSNERHIWIADEVQVAISDAKIWWKHLATNLYNNGTPLFEFTDLCKSETIKPGNCDRADISDTLKSWLQNEAGLNTQDRPVSSINDIFNVYEILVASPTNRGKTLLELGAEGLTLHIARLFYMKENLRQSRFRVIQRSSCETELSLEHRIFAMFQLREASSRRYICSFQET